MRLPGGTPGRDETPSTCLVLALWSWIHAELLVGFPLGSWCEQHTSRCLQGFPCVLVSPVTCFASLWLKIFVCVCVLHMYWVIKNGKTPSPGWVVHWLECCPATPSFRFNSWSGHIREWTNECVDKWDNKAMFPFLPLPYSLSKTKK